MKKLFNNPWFIAALGALGAIYLGLSLYQHNTDGADVISDAADDIPAFVESGNGAKLIQTSNDRDRARVAAVNRKSTGNASIDDISWLMDIERDPFAVLQDGLMPSTLSDADGTAVASQGTELAPHRSATTKSPKLTAVFVGDQTRAAVINKRLLHEGDRIGRYQVVAISQTTVELRYGETRLLLEPDA